MTPPAASRFDRAALLAAFDRIGETAESAGALLDFFVYGGSALMLASNFRYATEDVDIASLGDAWPVWLSDTVRQIAEDNDWDSDWLNEAVQFHLSPAADAARDHVLFATFPRCRHRSTVRAEAGGLRVSVPSATYMLALKLKALRINDPVKGPAEAEDVRNLIRVVRIRSLDEAIDLLGRYFPRSANDADRQRFFLKHIWPKESEGDEPPRYPLASG